jgi:hypothetical protein
MGDLRVLGHAHWALGLCLLLAVGCATGRPTLQAAAQSSDSAYAEPGRAVIRTASIRVSVADPTDATAQVVSLVEAIGGYVEHSHLSKDESATVRIRVPANQLEPTLVRIAGLGDEEERQVSARDVTEEMADLEAALQNNRSLRDRLRQLLDRAKSVEDVLKVERELNRIQTEIDRQEGKLKRLRSQVELSLVSVQLDRRQVLGPLGYAVKSVFWVLEKLFVIQD